MKIIFVFLFVVVTSGSLFAAPKTIEGEVVDTFCYIARGAKGAPHAKCAAECMQRGVPASILTSDGQIYLPMRRDHLSASTLLQRYAGEKVKATGEIYEKHNTKYIILDTVEKVVPENPPDKAKPESGKQ